MRKVLFGLFSLFLFLNSCDNTDENLTNYLKKINLSVDSKDKTIVAIIPGTSCGTCSKQVVETLNRLKNKNKVCVIFATFDKTIRQNYISLLDSNIQHFEDKKEMVYKYDLLKKGDPTLYFIENGDVSNKVEYNFKLGTDFLMKEINKFCQD